MRANKTINHALEVLVNHVHCGNHKKHMKEVLRPVVEKHLHTHCQCCGRMLTRFDSMIHGLGHLCDHGKCLCKVERKLWNKEEIRTLLKGA